MPHIEAYWLLVGLMGDIGGDYRNIAMCPHAPADNCHCRKPVPGLLLSLMERNKAIPKDTLFVGNDETDRQAAMAAGCQFAWAWDFFGWSRVGEDFITSWQ